MQTRASSQKAQLGGSTNTAPLDVPEKALDALQDFIRASEVSVLQANAPMSALPAGLFYYTVLDAFQPRSELGLFSGDRVPVPVEEGNFSNVALCIRSLLPFANPVQKQPMDVALFSLLTMYMGRLVNNPKVVDMAHSAYTSAIRDFRLVLGSSVGGDDVPVPSQQSQLFLALSTALQMFEVRSIAPDLFEYLLTDTSSSKGLAKSDLASRHIIQACSSS
jgi:hypothetical protein